MALLQIDRKDAEQADPAKILEASFHVEKPFGIQTVTLKPEDVEPRLSPKAPLTIFGYAVPFSEGFGAYVQGRAIAKEIRKTLHERGFEATAHTLKDIKGSINILKRVCLINEAKKSDIILDPGSSPAYPKGYKPFETWTNFADETYNQETYKAPILNIVVGPSANYDLMKEIIPGCSVSPEYRSLLNTFALWHEYAHGTGAGEPQSDKMSSIVCRKLFNDQALTALVADLRAVHTVGCYNNKSHHINYGWRMVEANDAAASMTDEQIAAMDEDAIKAIRFEKFDVTGHEDAVKKLGEKLYETCRDAFKSADLVTLAATAEKFVEDRTFGEDDDMVYRIAARFSLAAERLGSGMALSRPSTAPSP